MRLKPRNPFLEFFVQSIDFWIRGNVNFEAVDNVTHLGYEKKIGHCKGISQAKIAVSVNQLFQGTNTPKHHLFNILGLFFLV